MAVALLVQLLKVESSAVSGGGEAVHDSTPSRQRVMERYSDDLITQK